MTKSLTIIIETSLSPIKLPRFEELRKDLVRYDDVARVKEVFRTDPKYPAYHRQQQLDRKVFRTLVVGGFEDNCCPKDEDWAIVCLAGAICVATTCEVLQPLSCHLLTRGSELYYGVWQLVWDRLEVAAVPKRIKESLYRLLVPESHPGDSRDRGETDCEAASIWKTSGYCPGSNSFGQLALGVYKQGASLDDFKASERPFLQELIKGMATMRTLVEKEISPLYHW